MDLKELYSQKNYKNNGFFTEKTPVISFEIFPPKDDTDGTKLDKLVHHLEILKKYNPSLVSITYGAGGGTQQKSFEIIKRLQNELSLNIMPHFTCVCSSKNAIEDYLKEIESLGIKNILALRGDIPLGMETSTFDFHYANELVEFIKHKTKLSIGVAGYPEGHIECDDFFKDLDNLKRKVDSGADVIYTQLFFDNEKFFNFVQLTRDAGINIPIVPGILPITSYSQLDRMLSMARVTLPQGLKDRIEKVKNQPDEVKKIGIEFASYQCQQLIDAEVSGLHFYTINSSKASSAVLDNLGF